MSGRTFCRNSLLGEWESELERDVVSACAWLFELNRSALEQLSKPGGCEQHQVGDLSRSRGATPLREPNHLSQTMGATWSSRVAGSIDSPAMRATWPIRVARSIASQTTRATLSIFVACSIDSLARQRNDFNHDE